MRSCTKNIVPDSTNGLDARKYMGEPGQYPWNDENDKVDLSEAFEYTLELLILGEKKS